MFYAGGVGEEEGAGWRVSQRGVLVEDEDQHRLRKIYEESGWVLVKRGIETCTFYRKREDVYNLSVWSFTELGQEVTSIICSSQPASQPPTLTWRLDMMKGRSRLHRI